MALLADFDLLEVDLRWGDRDSVHSVLEGAVASAQVHCLGYLNNLPTRCLAKSPISFG